MRLLNISEVLAVTGAESRISILEFAKLSSGSGIGTSSPRGEGSSSDPGHTTGDPVGSPNTGISSSIGGGFGNYGGGD